MGRHSTTVREKQQKTKETHPVWRGIGCMIIILVPILSYVTTRVTLPMFNSRGLVPRDLRIALQMPDWMWSINPGLTSGIQKIIGNSQFLPTVLLTLIYIMILGSLFSIIYSLLYRMLNPKRYGPMDAPPIRVKTKKYRR
jgi:hypothetical protein